MSVSIFIKNTANKGWIILLESYLRLKHIILYTIHPKKLFGETYFPETQTKNNWKIYKEQMVNIIKYNDINHFYYLYGLDVKDERDSNDYIHYNLFKNKRDILNGNNSNKTYAKSILRDKIIFGIIADFLNINTPKNIAYIISPGKVLQLETKRNISLKQLLTELEGSFYCKLLDGECGNGIFKLSIGQGEYFINDQSMDIDEACRYFDKGQYLIQKQVIQHHEMSRLYPKSINTIRLITVKNPDNGLIDCFPSILRVGAHGSIIDNTSKGGFAVGFDLQSGNLYKYGFHKPQYGKKITHHPDTGIELRTFKIPFLQEAIEKAKLFHEFLGLHSIGWDIAIGPDGPIFIEGNDNWEINGPQSVHGGLRKTFQKYFKTKK